MGQSISHPSGSGPRVETATPGSYGLPPEGYRLPDATRLGRVQLQIANLSRSLEFYERTLGLRVLEREVSRATLAAHGDDRVLVELIERDGTQPAARGRLGLYHVAILLPDRPSLGRFVRHLGASGVRAGAGDHLVSEAFYVTNPDGLGIEVYADRPRSAWKRVDRELMLATDPVDVASLVEAAGDAPWTGMPAGTVIGHVHLHVSDLDHAAAFYAESLGFDRMTWSYPGALFLGAGGYHHHLGTNLWAGPNARAPQDDEAKLLEWTIEVPTRADIDRIVQSLIKSGRPVDRVVDSEALTCDPWGTAIRVRSIHHGM
jgi:catechol 2,3-dioxygenase